MACMDQGSKSLRELKAAQQNLQTNFSAPLVSSRTLKMQAPRQMTNMNSALPLTATSSRNLASDSKSVKSMITQGSQLFDQKADFNYHLQPTDAEEFLAAQRRDAEIQAQYQNMLLMRDGLTDAKMQDQRQLRLMLMMSLKEQFDHSRFLQAFHDNFWVPTYMTNIESTEFPFTFKIASGDNLPDFSPVDAATFDGLNVWGSKENYAQGWNLPVQEHHTGELENAYVLGAYISNIRNEYDQAIGLTIYHQVANGREEPMGGTRFVRNGKRYHFVVNPRSIVYERKLVLKSNYRINNTYAETYPFMTTNPKKLQDATEEFGSFYAVKVDHPVLKYAVSQLAFRKNWTNPNGQPVKMFEFSTTSGSEDKVLIPKSIYNVCQNEVIQQYISALPIVNLKAIRVKAEFIKNSGGPVPVPRDRLATSTQETSVFSLNMQQQNSVSLPLCDGHLQFYYAFRDVKESYDLDDDLVKQTIARGVQGGGLGESDDIDGYSEDEDGDD